MTSRIETNSEILGEKPVIKGTRISVEFVLHLLAQGWSEEEILHNYPSATKRGSPGNIRI